MYELVGGILVQAPTVAAAGDPCSVVTLPPCQLSLMALSGAVVLWRIAPVSNVSVQVCLLLPVRTLQPALSQGQGPCAVCFEGETQGFCFLCVSRLLVQMYVSASGVIPQELSTGVFYVIAFVYFFVCVCICMCIHMAQCTLTMWVWGPNSALQA